MADLADGDGREQADRHGAVPGPDFAAPGGLSWCWQLNLDSVLDAVTGVAPWLRDAESGDSSAASPAADSAATDSTATDSNSTGSAAPPEDAAPLGAGDMEADEAAYQEALAAGCAREVPLDLVAGRVAESMAVGPDLAAWLALARAADLEDGALAGVAASFRRLASWAAAGELAAVAQIASRSARADRRASVDKAGRPDRVTSDAAGQVALALAMSHDGATDLADLAVVLTWRLIATGAALASGEIDLARARMIARMTSALSDADARKVEAAVLGRAGWQTLGQLHAALRRAVIKADPQGAERRRQRAERNAQVAFYPEDEGTATLAGYSLPGVQAAAAMARITALAKALQVAGADGQIDLVRAQVFLGLLLGTLPYVPPAPGAPADDSPPSDAGPCSDEDPPGDPGSPGEEAPPRDEGQPCDNAPPCDEGKRSERPVADDRLPGGSLAGVRLPAAAGGELNLTLSLATLAAMSAEPGQLSRLGVITADQAIELARAAAAHSATRWRVVVTDARDRAIAVAHIPRSRRISSGGSRSAGLIRQVTLIARAGQALRECDRSPPAGPKLAQIVKLASAAAARVAAEAEQRERRDELAGGCAHDLASAAYRPPPRVAEFVIARDRTCRFRSCRRPAEQCDLDHVIPYHESGLTCACNIGSQCRLHHQLKQHPGWKLTEPTPGVFRWTTPVGRTYAVHPDPYR
jgi:uncharacterized protein DUF222